MQGERCRWNLVKNPLRMNGKQRSVRSAGREMVDPSGQELRILLDSVNVIHKEFFHGFDYVATRMPTKDPNLLSVCFVRDLHGNRVHI